MGEKKETNFEKRLFIKLIEVESLYGVPAETVRKWIRRDSSDGIPALKAFKPGKDILINRKEFELYIKRFPAA